MASNAGSIGAGGFSFGPADVSNHGDGMRSATAAAPTAPTAPTARAQVRRQIELHAMKADQQQSPFVAAFQGAPCTYN